MLSDEEPRILLNQEQAQKSCGSLPKDTFNSVFGDLAIRLGKGNYYRPDDLKAQAETLPTKADRQ